MLRHFAALAMAPQMRYFLLRFGRVENRFEFRLGEESPNSIRRDATQPRQFRLLEAGERFLNLELAGIRAGGPGNAGLTESATENKPPRLSGRGKGEKAG